MTIPSERRNPRALQRKFNRQAFFVQLINSNTVRHNRRIGKSVAVHSVACLRGNFRPEFYISRNKSFPSSLVLNNKKQIIFFGTQIQAKGNKRKIFSLQKSPKTIYSKRQLFCGWFDIPSRKTGETKPTTIYRILACRNLPRAYIASLILRQFLPLYVVGIYVMRYAPCRRNARRFADAHARRLDAHGCL